jgi:hypothetical protein
MTASPIANSVVLPQNRRRLAALAAALTLASVLGACSDSSRRPARKTVQNAVWVNSSSEALQPNAVSRLKEAGVEEVFLQAARFDPASGEVVTTAEQLALPATLACTVAISGSFRSAADPAALADRLLAAFREAQARIEQEETLVVGLHLDFTAVESFEDYGRLLAALREKLSPKLFLSVTVQRSWLGNELLKPALEHADFFVPFLFGQRIDEREDNAAWDLANVERQLQAADALGHPYLLGIVDLGTATWSKGGVVKERVTKISMKELVRNPDIQLRPGFSLEGTNRRVYTFEVQRPTELAGWSLPAGDSVRIVRLAASDLEELLRRLDLWANPNRVGQLYYRIPHADERLSFGAESLASALQLDSKSLDLNCEVAVQRRTGRGWLVRFTLINSSGGFSELALLDNNYLEVKIESGSFGTNASAGDFQRYDLLKETGGKRERSFRSPDILRLYAPMLEGQQRVVSGDIEVITPSAPTFRITGNFLLPEGKDLTLGPFIYKNGVLEKISSTTTE